MIRAFGRLFKVVEAQTHAAIDKLEDPIKQTEQGIRDLKKDLEESLKNLAQVKAITIRLKKELEEKKQTAADYERKAILLLEKAQKGELSPEDGDRLASEALVKKDQATQDAVRLTQDVEKQANMTSQMEANVKQLKSQISTWENELTTLRARAKVASASKKLNQQLSKVDSNGTIAMLEKMKSKVQEDEALAQSYGEMASLETDIDSEINKALGSSADTKTSSSLAELKAKMNLG